MTTAVRFLRLIACLMMLLTLQALEGVFGSTSVEIASSALTATTDITASQSPALATFPFYDGFESGTLGSDWTVYTTNEGRVQVADSYPYSGTYGLLLDDYSDDSIDSLAAAILTIDLSGQSQVDLDFWCHDFTDVADPEDGVFISDDGTTWHQVLDLKSIPNFYRHYIINLDAEAASAGMALNDHFQIKFQFYEDDPVPVDGFAIDEVQVRSPPVVIPAAFPYYQGFESGSLGNEWLTDFTNEGRVQVANSYPHSGTYGLLLDDYRDDSIDSLAAAILTIDLSGQSQVDLDFWCHDFTDVVDPEDGVFISDDGTTWHQVLDLDSIPNFYRHYIIDLDAEAASAGMILNDRFQIKFQFYEDDPVPVDGLAIDEVQVRSPPVPIPATFPYHQGFEAGSLGDEWLIDFTNEGRVQVADSYPYSGTYSLLLDDYRDDSIYSLAAAILTIDLGGQPDVMLDFWWRGFYDEAHPEDGVFISDDDGTTWYLVLSFGQTSAWQREVIDLDAEAASAGMAFNDHFQIKFQFYEDDPIPGDGYTIDEVQVRPNAPPVLTWPGDTNYEQDGLDPESGDIRDTYVYRIKYADADGDPPALVQVHVDKGGIGIAGSPFTMDCIPGDYAQGVICSHSQEGLEEGSDYTYSFAGQDDRGNQAQSTPVLDAPDVTVTYWIHLPLVMRNAGPPAGPPHLDPIDNPSGHYSYTISWSTVERATRYTLEEDDNSSFSSPEVVYSGSHTSTSVVVQATGTYYYRVKASNKFGETGWSNTRSTVVTVAPPPCPQPGYWAGFTDQGYPVNYDLADTPDCEVTRLRITARLDCVMNPVDLEYTVEYFFSAPVVAREFEYYVSDGDYSERVSGTFTSQTAATGRWFFFVPDPNSPVPGRFCTGGGSWSATYRP